MLTLDYSLSLVKFNNTVNTITFFWCQGRLQIDVLSGNHKIKSAVPFILLTQIEEPKKRNSTVKVTNTCKEKVEKHDRE